MRILSYALTLLIAATASVAYAQEEEKAVMIVQNYRNETITMNFAYVLNEYTWTLMERDIPVDGNITYKFPTGLPGCEYLTEWDIDNARLTVSNSRGEICRQEISICERREIGIEVRRSVCYMRKR